MTSSDLIHELRASRPAAPTALRARIREISSPEVAPSPWSRFRFPVRRAALIAIPATAVLAFASAGVLGITRSDGSTETYREEELAEKALPEWQAAPSSGLSSALPPAQDSAIGPTTGRAQRVSATLTVEVADADAVSRAAQDALDLTRSLGGHVVNASVATGDEGSASLIVRVPVSKVQEAIVRLSSLRP